MKFMVEIEFSDDVLECANDIALERGDNDANRYLERLVEKGLEGENFRTVDVTVVRTVRGRK